MTNLLNSPNKKTRFSRLDGLGAPFIGRRVTGLTSSANDLTNNQIPQVSYSGTASTAITSQTPAPSTQALYVDSIAIQAIPATTAVATDFFELDLTSGAQVGGTATTKLFFMNPSDAAVGSASQRNYTHNLRPEGNFVIPPSYKLQGLLGAANTAAVFPEVTGMLAEPAKAQGVGLPTPTWIPQTVIAGSTTTVINVTANTYPLPLNNGGTGLTQSTTFPVAGDAANAFVGMVLYCTGNTTTALLGQQRTIVGTTATVLNGVAFLSTITVDRAFTTAPQANDVVEIRSPDIWVASLKPANGNRTLLLSGISGGSNMSLAATSNGTPSGTVLTTAAMSYPGSAQTVVAGSLVGMTLRAAYSTASAGSTTTITVAGTPYTASTVVNGVNTGGLVGQTVTMIGGTAGNIGVSRTVLSNTNAVITVSSAFPSAVANTDTFRLSGYHGIGRTITANAAATITIGSAMSSVVQMDNGDVFDVEATGTPDKCIQILGWHVTGYPTVASLTPDLALNFVDQGEEWALAGTGTVRPVHRWSFPSGLGTTTKTFIQQTVNDCEITGPPGYGLTVKITQSGSNELQNACAIIVWGRYVNADRHFQYQPHGVPVGLMTVDGASCPRMQPNPTSTASSGTLLTLVDQRVCPLATTLASSNFNYWQGANMVIVGGTGAGQTRRICGTSGSAASTTFKVSPAWDVVPDSTTKFTITGFDGDRFWFQSDNASITPGSSGAAQALFHSESTPVNVMTAASCTATSGSTTTFVASGGLTLITGGAVGANTLVDAIITMTGGTAANIGAQRQITVSAATTLTFSPALPSAVAAGDTCVVSQALAGTPLEHDVLIEGCVVNGRSSTTGGGVGVGNAVTSLTAASSPTLIMGAMTAANATLPINHVTERAPVRIVPTSGAVLNSVGLGAAGASTGLAYMVNGGAQLNQTNILSWGRRIPAGNRSQPFGQTISVSSGSTTTSLIVSPLILPTNSANGAIMLCTGLGPSTTTSSAANLGVYRFISANSTSGTTTTFTVGAFPATPNPGDTFQIIGSVTQTLNANPLIMGS